MRFLLVSSVFSFLCIPLNVGAHSFDERYDLPIPLEFFLIGSAAILGLSFLLILIASQYWSYFDRWKGQRTFACPKTPLLEWLVYFFQAMSLLLLVVVIAAGYFGPQNPLMNLAPTFIWINWWVGFSLCISLVGNFWPLVNPWSVLFDCLRKALQYFGLKRRFPILALPGTVGVYPATFFLLVWGWMEVVYPIAFVPQKITTFALIWTIVSMLGMAVFGKMVWIKQFDFFSICFNLLGEFGILGFQVQPSRMTVRLPGRGILLSGDHHNVPQGLTAFIIAMLIIVLFDGIHGSGAWPFFQEALGNIGLDPSLGNGYIEGTIGLITLWLSFFGIYYFACWVSHQIVTSISLGQIIQLFSRPLIPIAIAYLFAHNFSSLLNQGQSIIFLISDPLGLGWNLFGGAQYRPVIGLIDVGQIWYLAVCSIILGHVIALVLTHAYAMRISSSAKMATLMTIPQTIFMILLTMMSLIILAEPLTSSEFSLLNIWISK